MDSSFNNGAGQGSSLLREVALTNEQMESALNSGGNETLHEATQNVLVQEVGSLILLGLAIMCSSTS